MLDHEESMGISEKGLLLTTLKPFLVDHKKLWEILKEIEYQTTLPASWEIYIQIKKQQLEPNMEQMTDSKLEKK